MTTRLLPDIDLARIAPQRDDMKRKSLEQMKGGFSTFSYKPVRACFSDIFNIQPDLDLGAAEPTPWGACPVIVPHCPHQTQIKPSRIKRMSKCGAGT